MRQYVAVKFNAWDQRSYTYHNDGDPVEIGDEILVEARGEQKRVVVDSIPFHAPTKFETKPIIGKAPPKAPSADIQFGPVDPSNFHGDPSAQ